MAPAPKIQIVVVEGDPRLRKALCARLAQQPFVDVVGSAGDCTAAVPKIAAHRPEWVVVDLASDPIGGLSLLDVMRSVRLPTRCAVIADGADAAMPGIVAEARRQGVQCVVRRSSSPDEQACDLIVRELLAAMMRHPHAETPAQPAVASSAPSAPAAAARPAPPAIAVRPARALADRPPTNAGAGPAPSPASTGGQPDRALAPRILAIGVSTGGPSALAQLLPALPADFPLPVLVVQHMPPDFTRRLASSLDRDCALRVREAAAGDRLRPGEVLIAPGGRHLRVAGSASHARCELTDDPPVRSCRPSVDYLFVSLAGCFGARTLGVVLTGMGEDGWRGSHAIADAGGQLLAQDEASCTVYGMPRGPIESGIAEGVALADMAAAILRRVRGGGR